MKKRKNLQIVVSYESNRFGQSYLISAFEKILPIMKRSIELQEKETNERSDVMEKRKEIFK